MSLQTQKIHLLSTLSRKRNLILQLLLAVLLFSCDTENANDCLQTDGDIITYEIEVPVFTKIQMEDDIRVLLKQGAEQQVIIETGENLVSDLNFEVSEGTLVLQNNNSCNILREYGRTLVTITSPNISFIRQASSFDLKSEGVLSFPTLTLFSNTNPNSLDIDDPNKSGNVYLNLAVPLLRISANGSSNFVISGRADQMNISFSDELPQFDGRDFLVDNIQFTHTSAAAMVFNPINSLKGTIRATGDVIVVNEPPLVEVEVLFTGQLIFED
ncbi:head GIN domain-containing protein [uncultured Dokdonia sp.]|uniref:head GIN domain-containing protein n=1 Tax=Dokdonia sp. R78006 TaxID=3093866 RepID=UPI002602C6F5|nr:head GIN domain-containing protein [uncultured Dokdonia sp.]